MSDDDLGFIQLASGDVILAGLGTDRDTGEQTLCLTITDSDTMLTSTASLTVPDLRRLLVALRCAAGKLQAPADKAS